MTIESEAGFELALELTVKATLDRRRVAEVPTTWRDRTAGESNFKLRQWLPHYLHWYWVAMRGRWIRRSRDRSVATRDSSQEAMSGIAYRPDLDGLRAIAVGLVMFAHLGWPIRSNADIGVTAFFVLSGYLITSILVRERERTGRIGLGAFYRRRVLRLGPALLGLLAFTLVLGLAGAFRGRERHRLVNPVRLQLGPGGGRRNPPVGPHLVARYRRAVLPALATRAHPRVAQGPLDRARRGRSRLRRPCRRERLRRVLLDDHACRRHPHRLCRRLRAAAVADLGGRGRGRHARADQRGLRPDSTTSRSPWRSSRPHWSSAAASSRSDTLPRSACGHTACTCGTRR